MQLSLKVSVSSCFQTVWSFSFIDMASIYHPNCVVKIGQVSIGQPNFYPSVFAASDQVEISFCTWDIIGWRKTCWSLLFPFCFLINQLCMGKPGNCSFTIQATLALRTPRYYGHLLLQTKFRSPSIEVWLKMTTGITDSRYSGHKMTSRRCPL